MARRISVRYGVFKLNRNSALRQIAAAVPMVAATCSRDVNGLTFGILLGGKSRTFESDIPNVRNRNEGKQEEKNYKHVSASAVSFLLANRCCYGLDVPPLPTASAFTAFSPVLPSSAVMNPR